MALQICNLCDGLGIMEGTAMCVLCNNKPPSVKKMIKIIKNKNNNEKISEEIGGEVLDEDRIKRYENCIIDRNVYHLPSGEVVKDHPSRLVESAALQAITGEIEERDKFTSMSLKDISKIQTINVNFNGSLRPHQIQAVTCISDSYEKVGGGLLCLGCGLGKTVVATHMISKMKMKTAVIVHKEFLLNQWKERIHQFLPDARIGRVQGSVQDIKDKDIILVMLQTLSQPKRDFTNVFEDCGQLIVDECHHIAAKVFSSGVSKIPALYTLGLSATPERKDGLTKLIHWFLGPTVLTMENLSENEVIVHTHKFDMDYPQEVIMKNQKVCLPSIITNMSNMPERNNKICDIILSIIEREDGVKRKIMVLSERRDQLKQLRELLIKDGCSAELYIGGMKEDKLKIAEKATVILSTYLMTAEGFDHPMLNTLVFATPKTDIEQAVGRILRKVHEISPIIVDIVDNYSLFPVQSYQRRYFYKNREYKLKQIKNISSESNDDSAKKLDKPDKPYKADYSLFNEDDE